MKPTHPITMIRRSMQQYPEARQGFVNLLRVKKRELRRLKKAFGGRLTPRRVKMLKLLVTTLRNER